MKREASIIFGLIAITLVAFGGLGHCGFVNFDDPTYVFLNPHVTGGLSMTNVAWAWKTFYQGNYLPLTWLSLMLDATLFGIGPYGFHWTNIAFHAANAVLLFLVFRQATSSIWRSALVAAIFAVHPLRVESVAWIVERKDVLTGFFCLLAVLAYLRFARSLRWAWYVITLLFFAATLLAKQTLCTLPFLLLLLDYWPLGRWVRGPAAISSVPSPRRSLLQLILEKLPLLGMSVAILIVTIKAQASSNSISGLEKVPFGWRLANAPVSYARYLGKMVWFSNLAILYPRHPWSVLQVAGSCTLLVTITAVCLWKLRLWPWLTIGWLWFLGVLAPMIGLVQFGPQAMADRFTYFSGIGVLVMVAWSIPAAVARKPVLVVAAVGTSLSILMVFTMAQTRYWHDSVALFAHDIAVAGSNPVAETNIGVALTERGKLPEAIGHLQAAVSLNPGKANAQCDLATALAKNHQIKEALPHSIAAVRCSPKEAYYRLQLAFLLVQSKRYEEAAGQCRKAIELDPESAEAHQRLGLALCEMGKTPEGVDQLRLALSIMPHMREAQVDLERFQDGDRRPH